MHAHGSILHGISLCLLQYRRAMQFFAAFQINRTPASNRHHRRHRLNEIQVIDKKKKIHIDPNSLKSNIIRARSTRSTAFDRLSPRVRTRGTFASQRSSIVATIPPLCAKRNSKYLLSSNIRRLLSLSYVYLMCCSSYCH